MTTTPERVRITYTDADRITRDSAADLQPGDVIAGDDGPLVVVEQVGRYWVPFPGFYAQAVRVRLDTGITREVMLKPDVQIPLTGREIG